MGRPVAAIMAVHPYFLRRQSIDIEALYDPPGHSRPGDVRWDAMVSFLLGIAATWFFEFGIPPVLRGPGARMVGNVDVSWLAGLVVAGGLYAVLGSRRRQAASALTEQRETSRTE